MQRMTAWFGHGPPHNATHNAELFKRLVLTNLTLQRQELGFCVPELGKASRQFLVRSPPLIDVDRGLSAACLAHRIKSRHGVTFIS